MRNILDFFDSGFEPKVPYMIAEAGVNHEGSMDLAKKLIDLAKEGGADAIKFQSYKADKIASKYSPAYWDLTKEPTTSQYELFKKYDSFWKGEYEELKKHCEYVGIEFLSTPFDIESAAFLNDLCKVFKISSSDLNNKPFVEFICNFGKPIVLSTGASTLAEIKETVSLINSFGNDLALLHCVLNYPTEEENAHLGRIAALKQEFPSIVIGYSDHTLPEDMETLVLATQLGAKIIEKHFTFDKTLPGNDHYHSMDVEDLKHYNRRIQRVRTLMGRSVIGFSDTEAIARQNARRSLVANNAIAAGQVIGQADLTWKRPGNGISPDRIAEVVGRIAAVDIGVDELIQWEHLK